MTSLLDLANELLLQIISKLDRKEDQETIQVLRKTNVRLRNLTKPFVYLTVEDRIPYPPSDKTELEKIGPLQLTARRLAQYPALSYSVRNIQLSAWDQTGTTRRLLGHGPTLDQYSKALQRADVSALIRELFLADFEFQTSQGNLAFLLVLCTDLEILNISSGFPGFGPLVAEVFRDAAALHYQYKLGSNLHEDIQKPNILGSLKEITFGSLKQTSISEFLLMLALPSVQTLKVSDLSNNEGYRNHDIPPEDETYRNNNHVKLIFDMCCLNGAGIGRILRACSRPYSLTIEWRPGAWNNGLSNRDIGDAVRRFGTKLEHLHLDTIAMYDHRFGERPPAFGSFSELTNLRSIAIPLYAFTSECADAASALPPTLEKLYVLGVDDHLMEDGIGPFHGLTTDPRLPELKEVKHVKWGHYSLEEWFGTAHHRFVDYSDAKELELVARRS
jgi:hypothetical protein